MIEPDGSGPRETGVSGVVRFDGYIDARRLDYTRNMLDGSGRIESVAAHLVTADEVVLLTGNATEVSVAPDGPLEDFVLLNARACRPRGS